MIAIFTSLADAQAYANKVHAYLQAHCPNYRAERWSVPFESVEGGTWYVKAPVEEEIDKWDVPIDTATEISKAVGITVSLPDTGGLCEVGKYYQWKGAILKCRQTHNRTIYEPKDTPALFSYFRDNSDQLEWIAGEQVEVGWMRIYNGVQYEVIQAHQTQSDWTPDRATTLWKIYVDPTQVIIPVWKQPTGAHDAYQIGDKVHFPTINDPVYESLIPANVYSPISYPAGWKKL